jgi:hypothetical protein
MKQTKEKIQKEIRKLRKIVDGDDLLLSRTAYVVECALRWSIEDTTGWDTPSVDVQKEAESLRTEIEARGRWRLGRGE